MDQDLSPFLILAHKWESEGQSGQSMKVWEPHLSGPEYLLWEDESTPHWALMIKGLDIRESWNTVWGDEILVVCGGPVHLSVLLIPKTNLKFERFVNYAKCARGVRVGGSSFQRRKGRI